MLDGTLMPKRDSRPQLAQPAQQYSGGSVKYQLIVWGVLLGAFGAIAAAVYFGITKGIRGMGWAVLLRGSEQAGGFRL